VEDQQTGGRLDQLLVWQVDYGRQRERGQACLSVVASFAKAGREEFLGMPLQLPSIPGLPEVRLRR